MKKILTTPIIIKLSGVLLFGLSLANAAFAADYTVTASGNWSAATWVPGLPPTGGGADHVIWSGKTGNSSYTNDLGAGTPKEFLLNSVVWAAGGPLFAGDQLAFVPDGATQPSIVYASTNSPNRAFPFYNNIRIQDGATLTINGNGSTPRGAGTGTGYEFRGAISGAADMVINATSNPDDSKDYVTFTAANTYTGTTTVNAGVLQLGDGTSGNNGTIANSLSLVNNGTVIYNLNGSVTYGGVISGGGAVVKTGSGTIVLTATNTYFGATTISNGTFRLGNGNSGKDGDLANSLSIVDYGTLDFKRSGGTYTYNGIISGTGAVTKSAGASTQILVGANSYSGGTTISAGILNIQNSTALGAALGDAASGTTVEDGATLQLQGDIALGTERLTLSGLGAAGQNGALVNLSGNNAWGGQVRIAAHTALAVDAGSLLCDNGVANVLQVTDNDLTCTLRVAAGATLQIGTGDENIGIDNLKTNLTFIWDVAGSGTMLAEILGAGGTCTLIKNGGGTWTLGRTYVAGRGWRGELQINGGTVVLGAPDAVSCLDNRNIVRVNDGAALDLAGNNNKLVGLGNAAGNLLGVVTNSSATACVLSVGDRNIASTFDGSVRQGAGAIGLTKIGTGAFTLTGANSYTGDTTVSAGTLLVNGSIANSAVTVDAGATLGGSGTIGSAAIINGTVAPGASIGTLAFSTVPALAGTTFMEIDKGAAPNADKIVLSSGTLMLGGALVVTNVGAPLAGGEVFDLFDAALITGSFISSPTLPFLGTDLNWWTGNLTVNGTIKVNRKPAGTADSLTTPTNTSVNVSLATLIANDSDADGDILAITGVANALPAGASVSLVAGIVTYTPKPDSNEAGSFEYTLDDGHGGVATVMVNVTVTGGSSGAPVTVVYGPVMDGNEFVVRFQGDPGTQYTVERSPDLQSWDKKENRTAPTDNSGGFGIGVFEVRDTNAPGARFYRTVHPSY